MQTIRIPFGEWLPDMPEMKAAATEAKGCIAAQEAYRPLPAFTSSGVTAIAAQAKGAKAFFDTNGDVIVFVGAPTKLYQQEYYAFTDRSGATYDCPIDAVWQFQQYGTKIIALNPNNNPQMFDMASPGNFADLGGSPPRARCIARIREFLVLGDITHPVAYPSRVQWSAFGDIVTWTGAGTNQADSEDLDEDAGRVQAIFNLYEAGFVFQERAIQRMEYVGLPTIFNIDVVERGQGPICGPHGMVLYQGIVYYVGNDGFYAFDGRQSVSISHNKVSRYFLANLNYAYRHNIFASYDYKSNSIWWAYPTGSNLLPDALLIYSIRDQRWTRDASVSLECLLSLPKRGPTMEELDAVSTDLDAIVPSLDSSIWQSTETVVGGFDQSHGMVEATGSNRECVLETIEVQPEPGKRSFVTEVWPLVDDDAALTVTAQVGYRLQRPGDTLTYTSASARNATGFAPVRSTGRYQRAKITMPSAASWTHAEGVDVKFRVEGAR